MEKSGDFLKKLLDEGPSAGTAFLVLNEMKSQGTSGEILQKCLTAVQRYPDDIRLKKLLAESYLELGFLGLAENLLSEITNEIDSHASLYKIQAQMFNRQKKTDACLDALKKYLAHFPDDPEALLLLDQITSKDQPDLSEKTLPQEITPEEAIPETDIPTEIQEPDIDEVPERIQAESTEQQEFTPEPEIEAKQTLEPEPAIQAELETEPGIEADAEAEIADMATPTLAELYYRQGEIQAAISTYEKIVSEKPEDLKSAQRLEELKAPLEETPHSEPAAETIHKQKTENAIAILENWRSNIQKDLNG